VIGRWRKLYNKEFHGSYSSPGINRVNKSRSMRWMADGIHWRVEKWVQNL
jgi:hypothetical protein